MKTDNHDETQEFGSPVWVGLNLWVSHSKAITINSILTSGIKALIADLSLESAEMTADELVADLVLTDSRLMLLEEELEISRQTIFELQHNVFMGGLELSNDVFLSADADFTFPTDQPSSYLMNGRLCRFFIDSLNAVVDLKSLPSVGDTDVSFSFEQADLAVKVMREKFFIDDDEAIAELESVFSNWRKVPNAAPSVWWNRAPFAFNLLPFSYKQEGN